MIIDATAFTGINSIPNISEPEPNSSTGNFLAQLIEICEDEVLSIAFGRVMWEDFKANPTEQIYLDLLDGKEYQYNGKTCNFLGLKELPFRSSLLTDFTYYRYHTINVTQNTEFGQVASDTKVGIKASSTPKITAAWNRFLEKFQGLHSSSGITPEGNPFWLVSGGVSYYGGGNGGEVSLMRFLSDNKEDYPLLQSSNLFGLEFKNSFGI